MLVVLVLVFVAFCLFFFFFFSSRRRHTRSDRDWSSDVCSSDLRSPGIFQKSRIRTSPHSIFSRVFLAMGAVRACTGACGKKRVWPTGFQHSLTRRAIRACLESMPLLIRRNARQRRSEEHTSELQSRSD